MRTHFFLLERKRIMVDLNVVGSQSNGRPIVHYGVIHDGVSFERKDFSPSYPLWQDAEGREAAIELLAFLACQPGDTDEGFFEDYTPEQLAWCKKYGEALRAKFPDK